MRCVPREPAYPYGSPHRLARSHTAGMSQELQEPEPVHLRHVLQVVSRTYPQISVGSR